MPRRYKVDISAISDRDIKVTYTLKNHIQYYEVMTRDQAIDEGLLYFKGSEYKISQKVNGSIKSLLRYGYFLYKFFWRETSERHLSDFVNINVI